VRAAGTPAKVLTADALRETYGIAVEVATDPATGHLTTRPVGRHSTRARVPA
jgi:iron complex transport system ATP-binding protein